MMLNTNSEDEGQQRRTNITCCILDSGTRCSRPAGNACYNKRIQKTIQQRRLKLVVDQDANHSYICDFHKNTIQNFRNQQKVRDVKADFNCSGDKLSHSEINFHALPVGLLRRYKRHYKLMTRPGFNKAQLSEIVAKHFSKLVVDQKEVLTYFLYTCKTNRSTGGMTTNGTNDDFC